MGDTYRPGGSRSQHYSQGRAGNGHSGYQPYDRSQDSGYRPREDNYRPQQYEQYAPPPPPPAHNHRNTRPPPQSYIPQPPLARNEPPRNPRGSDFTFRGAAGGQSYRPEQEFSFSAPSASSNAMDAPLRDNWGPAVRHNMHRTREADSGRGRSGYRGGDRGRGRGNFRGYGPRPAHDRDILNGTGRATTPEQMAGMDGGQARFKSISEASDDGNNEPVNPTQESDDETDGAGPRKRAKTETSAAKSAPKWSNPDPYTVLPPPETLGAPKKDIVQVIRKAKVDSAPKHEVANAVTGNDDFISFGDMGLEEADTVRQADARQAATQPASANFNHRENLHKKVGTAYSGEQTMLERPLPASTDYGGPPPRPLGLMLPTDEELAAMNIHLPKGTKRKGRDVYDLGDVTADWEGHDGQNTTPWAVVDHSYTAIPGLKLHKEICDFFAFVSPRDYEQRARQDLVSRVQDALRSARGADYSDAQVHCFGSFASGLYLPTADMDLVILSERYISGGHPVFGVSQNQLYRLRDHFNYCGIAKPGTTTAIAKAKVPLVKFVDKLTGIKVDISFENQSGFPATETFHKWKTQHPAMPVIVALAKQLLAMRNLNEVFSGGIGGFTTICLVMNILQAMPELQSKSMNSTDNYGEILMKFLDFFGNKFDITSAGITMHPPYYYNKKTIVVGKANPQRLTVIDPNNDQNDIAGGSRHIDAVFRCFGHAYNALQRQMAMIDTGKLPHTASILNCILGGNYQQLIQQREKLRRLYGGSEPADGVSLAPPPNFPPWDPHNAPVPTRAKKEKPMKKQKTKPPHQQSYPAQQQVSAPEGQYSLRGRTASKDVVAEPSKSTSKGPKPKKKIPDKPSKAARQIKAQNRSKSFKHEHPDVPDVPKRLNKDTRKKSFEKHGNKGK